MTVSIARATLLSILEQWPAKGEDARAASARLRQYLVDDFDIADLSNTPAEQFDVVSRTLRIGDQAKFIVSESGDPGALNLATMRGSRHGEWRLESFKFQCATCFGTGIHGADPCDVCGATGWGLRDGELTD